MNYNAKPTTRQSFGKKVKRVSDVNSMGYNPYEQQQANVQPQSIYSRVEPDPTLTNYLQQQNYVNQPVYGNQAFNPAASTTAGGYNTPNNDGNMGATPQVPLGVFGQPVVQDMAYQYGQQLAGAGKNIIKQEVEKYVPVTKLKYYFAVDTKYVISKLMLLFFPFTHSDWSVKYEQDGPVQPRYEINAPDLYIPTMAYVTYVLVAGLVLGVQQRFSPEQIGILASSALAWCLVELAVYSCTLYIIQVQTTLRTFDLLAYSGYKFVGTIFSILVSLVGGRMAYYGSLAYVNLALAFFLIRSLKALVLIETNTSQAPGYYGEPPATGNKRRLYFLLFVAVVQPVLAWWLSYHLLSVDVVSTSSNPSV